MVDATRLPGEPSLPQELQPADTASSSTVAGETSSNSVSFGSPVELGPGLIQFATSVNAAGSRSARVEPWGPSLVSAKPHAQTTLPAFSAAELERFNREDAVAALGNEKGRLRIGVGRTVDQPLVVNENAAIASDWTSLANGWRILSVALTSPGAFGIRVHLEGVKLPAGGRLVAYSPANPRPGLALTSQNLGAGSETWTETVLGSNVVIECQVPPEAAPAAVSFTVREISHIYQPLTSVITPNTACENDVTCYPAWANAAAGVARIEFIDSGSAYVCTGCLLNTSPATYEPYFLTANHCIGNQTVASTLELWWFYQTSVCNGQAPSLNSVPHTAGGADFLAGSSVNDFTFLHLRQAAPAGARYLGWSTTALDSGVAVTAIHHPGGDIKRISFGNQYGGDPNFWYVRWNNGVTEPGSSGSPLFNANQQVVGQLWGGSSGCTNLSGVDQFGRFDQTYNSIAQWLYPPVNDLCSGAVVLTDNVYYPQNTAGASDDSTPCAGTIGRGVWFTFRAPVTGMVQVDTCHSDFDTLLEVFTGACGSLTSIGCDDDSCGILQSSLTFPCLAGTLYHICAGGYGGAWGNLQVRAHATATPIGVIGLKGNLAFGSVPATQTETRTLIITNSGTGPVNVSGINYPAGFSGAWSGSIASFGSQSVPVVFSPVAQAGYSGTVQVTNDAALGSGSMPISGTGYWPLTNSWTLWWQNTNGTLALWSMLGTNVALTTRVSPPSAGPGWRVAGTADLNADQQTDLLFESSGGAVAAWLMNGGNQLSAAYLTPRTVDPAWQLRGTGDFNGDGQRDLLWQRSDGYLAVWLMNGLAATQTLRFNPPWTDPSWRMAGSGDFNGDARADLLWQNQDGRLAVWFMNGTNRVGAAYLNPNQVDPNWRLAASVDNLNGDGNPGLVWQHANGSLAYWQMAGTNCVHSGRLNPAAVDPAWQLVGPK
jgi:hypothetical protein